MVAVRVQGLIRGAVVVKLLERQGLDVIQGESNMDKLHPEILKDMAAMEIELLDVIDKLEAMHYELGEIRRRSDEYMEAIEIEDDKK